MSSRKVFGGSMDQTKIGKLIAKLRKEKGMTQRELGDKVGVGFKAVSKWERGITCPDISIINELSKILGITSDELLTGELSNEHQLNHKNNKKVLLIIPILAIIIIVFFLIAKINNKQVDIYELATNSDEYYVEGKAIFDKDEMSIYINKLLFYDKEFNKLPIESYKYLIESNDDIIINYGYFVSDDILLSNSTISEFTQKFTISHGDITNIDKKTIVKNNLNLKIIFLDNNNTSIEKNIVITLNKSK